MRPPEVFCSVFLLVNMGNDRACLFIGGNDPVRTGKADSVEKRK